MLGVTSMTYTGVPLDVSGLGDKLYLFLACFTASVIRQEIADLPIRICKDTCNAS